MIWTIDLTEGIKTLEFSKSVLVVPRALIWTIDLTEGIKTPQGRGRNAASLALIWTIDLTEGIKTCKRDIQLPALMLIHLNDWPDWRD